MLGKVCIHLFIQKCFVVLNIVGYFNQFNLVGFLNRISGNLDHIRHRWKV